MSEKACYLCIHRIKANSDEPCVKCLEFRTQYPYFVAVTNNCPESERCYNKTYCCGKCVRRSGYVESYDWFVDKADVEVMRKELRVEEPR